jgi:hypothetical protein
MDSSRVNSLKSVVFIWNSELVALEGGRRLFTVTSLCNTISYITVERIFSVHGKWPAWRTILSYVFISILYTFRATSCSSSGESIVSIQHLVYVTLCQRLFHVQVGDARVQLYCEIKTEYKPSLTLWYSTEGSSLGAGVSEHTFFHFIIFAPYVLTQLYNRNQRNAQFYKLMFNFWCLLHVSNLVVSSSGRQFYMHYGMFYMHRCEKLSGEESAFETLLPTRLLTPLHVKRTILHIQLSPWGWTHEVRNM